MGSALETGQRSKLGKEGEKDETGGRRKLSAEEIFSEKNVAVRRGRGFTPPEENLPNLESPSQNLPNLDGLTSPEENLPNLDFQIRNPKS